MKTFKYFETGFATKREVNEALNTLSASKIIDGEVNTYADLPASANHNGKIWIVKTTTGVIFVNKKVAGLYVSNGTTWTIITPVEIDGYQKLITTPTNDNIAITDANGQTKDGGKKISDLEQIVNKAIAFSATPVDTKYPSEKLVKNELDLKVDKSTIGQPSGIASLGADGKVPLDQLSAYVVDGAKINTIATDIVSASTLNLDSATGEIVNITGTTTITALTLTAGIKRFVRFTGILTLTNGASLVLPSGANITTASGDTAVFIGYASGIVRCVSYTKADGTAINQSGGSPLTTKGDIYVAGTGGIATRLPIGTNNQILIVDSTQETGLRWATPVGPPVVRTLASSLSNGVQSELQAYYDNQLGNNAPDTVPADVTLANTGVSGYCLYLGHNIWWYTFNNSTWLPFGGGAGVNKGDFSAPIARVYTFK